MYEAAASITGHAFLKNKYKEGSLKWRWII